MSKRSMHRYYFLVLLVAVSVCALPAAAQYKSQIRYTDLVTQLTNNGDPIPTGAGVLVAQVEAGVPGSLRYVPDQLAFPTTTIVPKSAGFLGQSSHATTIVGVVYYGDADSIAPGILTVDAFRATPYLTSSTVGYLLAGSTSAPDTLRSDARVFNHSWVGTFDDPNTNTDDFAAAAINLELMKRNDWVVERQDRLQVVGANNGSGTNLPLFASMFNGITVGLTGGVNHTSTPDIELAPAVFDPYYVAGRTKPDIVAPQGSTSAATPIVSALSTLLVEEAHTNALTLSNGSYTRTISTGNYTVYNAETSEVIKAIIMAGADKTITGYSMATANTANNLHPMRGAGEVDVLNAYNILHGGEHDPGTISQRGWDYNPNITQNTSAQYTALIGGSNVDLVATLVWNINIGSDFSDPDNIATEFYDLNLYLYDITGGGNVLMQSSTSTIDNTETIWFANLLAGRTYALRVEPAAGQDPFTWDYGLAWQFSGDVIHMDVLPEPAVAMMLFVGVISITARGCHRRSTRC